MDDTSPETKTTGQDPRSPSQDVSRTPIRIEQSKSTGVVREEQFDPRSPSNYIDRTPIQINTTQKVKKASDVKVALDYENTSPLVRGSK